MIVIRSILYTVLCLPAVINKLYVYLYVYIYSDKQLIRIQETPDEIPEGETPTSVTLFAFEDLVDSVRPGDRVQITGVRELVAG